MREKKTRCTNIGGQAVLEGVMMRGTRSMATAVRDENGNIQVESSRFAPVSTRGKFRNLPFVRGVFNLIDSMSVGVGTLMRASEVFEGEEEPTKFEKWCSEKMHFNAFKMMMWVAVAVGLLLSIGLFFFLPQLIMWGIREIVIACGANMPMWVDPLVEGVLRVAIFVGYILLTSLMKDIKRVYMYHGAEHKTISCYEHGLDMTVENVQKQTTIHDRCGTTFMFLVMVVSIVVFSLVNLLPIHVGNRVADMFIQLAVKLLFLPVVAGISYEILKFLAKFDNAFVNAIKAPGLLLQKVTTKQPTDDMVEVAITAFNTVLEMDKDITLPTSSFVTKVVMDKVKKDMASELDGKLGEGNADKEWILSEVLGVPRSELGSKAFVWSDQYDRIMDMTKRRANGEPLQQILGYTDFYGMDILVNSDVLCPRPETEYLVEACGQVIREHGLHSVLDMATGSGAIALVIKRDNEVEVTAVDISTKALAVARQNAEKNHLEINFIESDLFQNVEGKYDMIVSNPPYIPTSVVAGLDTEVKDYEPNIALDGGEDGLDYYRKIINDSADYLNEGGYLAFEIGYDQKQAVVSLLEQCEVANYSDIVTKCDLEGNDRIVIARFVNKK